MLHKPYDQLPACAFLWTDGWGIQRYNFAQVLRSGLWAA